MKSADLKRAQHWQREIDSLERSGLTHKAYCEKHKIKLSTLEYWRTRLNRSRRRCQSEKSPCFIPVKIGDNGSSGIILKAGRITIEVNQGFNHELLVEVLRAIGGAC